MQLLRGDAEFESLNISLNDETRFREYKRAGDAQAVVALPRQLFAFFVFLGDLVYGKAPSYEKFAAIEVVARVPYRAWSLACYTLGALWSPDEKRALERAELGRYARIAGDNETMHVVVIANLARTHAGFSVLYHVVLPSLFALGYFVFSFLLYLASPRYGRELNYLLEEHALEQYSRFLEQEEGRLRATPCASEFLAWYGRHPTTEFEFFRSVRNDELIHRNSSLGDGRDRIISPSS